MTNDELRAELDLLVVEYPTGANKKELVALLKAQEHVVTEEDLENNPELKEKGVKVGETIHLPAETGDVPCECGAMPGDSCNEECPVPAGSEVENEAESDETPEDEPESGDEG